VKKVYVKISLVLILGLLVISLPQVIGTNPESEKEVVSFEKVPLSDSEIKTRWNNLPTAEELWNSETKFFIDTRSFGKQVIDPQFVKDIPVIETEIEYEIMNYTADIPNFLRGGIMLDVPIIWLQYDETVWIQVPINKLY
jgi:hypothetical protein